MPHEGLPGDERATYGALDTSTIDGTRDRLPAARPRATEPPESSEIGKAGHRAKGGRRTGAGVKTVAAMAKAQSLAPGHRRAVCGESRRHGSGRGGRKRSARNLASRLLYLLVKGAVAPEERGFDDGTTHWRGLSSPKVLVSHDR